MSFLKKQLYIYIYTYIYMISWCFNGLNDKKICLKLTTWLTYIYIYHMNIYMNIYIYIYMNILCSLWGFWNFAKFVDTALFNGRLNQIIFRDLFFDFYCSFLVYLKWTLNPLFLRASSDSHFAVLNISSLDEFLIVSLGWNAEFASWRLVGFQQKHSEG